MLFLIPLILLLLEVSQTHGRYRIKRRYRQKRRSYRYRQQRPVTTQPTATPTPRPTASSSSIPRDKCKDVLDKPPEKRYQGPICLRLNETQLLAKLKEVGGFNPRYVAINREHALKFVDLTGDEFQLPANLSSLVGQNISQSNQSVITRDETRVRRKRSVPLSPGTNIRSCLNRGSRSGGGFSLCTECSADTRLPQEFFPPFINEVICGGDCLCLRNTGVCQQQVIKLNFLRFTGEFERDDDRSDLFDDDVFIEEVETYQQDIRTCCQCRSLRG